jgi:hypothetical protein
MVNKRSNKNNNISVIHLSISTRKMKDSREDDVQVSFVSESMFRI